MSRLAKVAFALSFFLLADAFSCHACTSVIISGKITEDGRLLKTVYTYDLDTSEKNRQKYFNWELLSNLQGTGIMQKVLSKEAAILPTYKAAMEAWRKNNMLDVRQLVELNAVADSDLEGFYKEEFDL
ncbi:MAG: hypothetical protein IKH49_09670 [Bacteroidales bacterium]|nr:hypothetical protein [Bacteroidales bacterium]